MGATREDKFGCIGDVCGSTRCLRFDKIPHNCLNAIREGGKDTKRDGIGAWMRNDRLLYLGLAIAAVGALLALLRRVMRHPRHQLEPHAWTLPPRTRHSWATPVAAPPTTRLGSLPPSLDDYILVPRNAVDTRWG